MTIDQVAQDLAGAQDVLHETEDGNVVEVPCTIHTITGRAFVVDQVGAWTQEPNGVFGTGHWADGGPTPTIDVLIPYARIDHLELDFASLKAHLESLKAHLESLNPANASTS